MTAKEYLFNINIPVEIVDTITVLQVQILGLFCASSVCSGKQSCLPQAAESHKAVGLFLLGFFLVILPLMLNRLVNAGKFT